MCGSDPVFCSILSQADSFLKHQNVIYPLAQTGDRCYLTHTPVLFYTYAQTPALNRDVYFGLII